MKIIFNAVTHKIIIKQLVHLLNTITRIILATRELNKSN